MMLTSRAMNPTRVSSRLSTRPLTVTIGVVDQLVAELHQGPREHRDLDRAVEILEHEHRHLVALLGELAGHVGDDAAEHEHRAVLALGRLGDAAVDLAAQRRLDARAADGRRRTGRASPSRSAAGRSCRTRCRGSRRARRTLRRCRRRGRRTGSSRPGRARGGAPACASMICSKTISRPATRMAERVERAGLDQRLDRALVEHRLGHALGEVVERLRTARWRRARRAAARPAPRRRCGSPTART